MNWAFEKFPTDVRWDKASKNPFSKSSICKGLILKPSGKLDWIEAEINFGENNWISALIIFLVGKNYEFGKCSDKFYTGDWK